MNVNNIINFWALNMWTSTVAMSLVLGASTYIFLLSISKRVHIVQRARGADHNRNRNRLVSASVHVIQFVFYRFMCVL